MQNYDYKEAGSSGFEHHYHLPAIRAHLLITASVFNMHLFTVIAFSMLLFIVGAVPVSPNPSPTGRPISIPLTKRSNHLREDGTIDSDKLDAGIGHTARFVFHLLFS